jgi:hypothetical protein
MRDTTFSRPSFLRSPGRSVDPNASRVERALSRMPPGVQPALRRLKWTALSTAQTMALRRERHYEDSYREVNRLTNQLAARDSRQRDGYTWCTLHAARLAQHLGTERITVAEFGVAGGRGLIALERAAEWAEQSYGVHVDVVGFDSGVGLAPPKDARDLPNLWQSGDFAMDEERLRAELERAELVVGWIAETLPRFLERSPAPFGFVVVDVDYYHATVDCLRVLRAPNRSLLPRVHCIFDDILGYTFADRNGERLAIHEFNELDPHRWIAPVPGLQHFVPGRSRFETWVDKVFLAHVTDHPDYGRYDGLVTMQQLPLG